MAKQFASLDQRLIDFIGRQRVFFTASAAAGTRVNVSPRGTEALRILDPNAVAYLDLTGSGNETAAHLKADGRLTLMFCAFEGPPMILRLYGQGHVLARGSEAYRALLGAHFGGEEPRGARQIVRLSFDLVQTSCGYGVPLFEPRGPRENIARWADSKTDEEIEAYRRLKNARSMDGLPTGMFEDEDASA